jgi:hypothetical protein
VKTGQWRYLKISYKKVKKYFDSDGLGECISVRDEIGDTVEHAAVIDYESWVEICRIWFINDVVSSQK